MPAEIRVRIFARDRELRAWLTDELALLSPRLEVDAIDDLDALAEGAPDLWIVGVEALTDAESAQLRTILERRRAPVIAVGTCEALPRDAFASVLDAKLTSLELKRAVRDCIARPAAAHRG